MTALLPDIPLYIYAALLAPIGLFVFAAARKELEIRVARNWPSVPGVVVASGRETRPVRLLERRAKRSGGYRFEERSFANTVYAYGVAGQSYTSNRVTIGEDRGDFEVAETIERYPVGKRVTVYYNPIRCSQAVIERELPGLWRGLGWIAAGAAAVIFGAVIGLDRLTQVASAHVANAPLTVAIGACGMFIALAALGIQHQARQARFWPVVQGIVRASGIEPLLADDDGSRERIRLHARIGYSYRFDGRDHVETIVALTGTVKSRSDGSVRRWAKRYRDGQLVDVYVNPEKPSESVLEPRARGIWVLWVIAIGLFALAAFVALRGGGPTRRITDMPAADARGAAAGFQIVTRL